MSAGDVFIVDDNPGDIRFIEEAFKASSLDPTVHTVKTRAEALDFIYQRNEYEDAPKPNVVLLDWNLSQSTGKDVLQASKSVSPPLPVAVMTGTTSEIHSVKSSLSQADAYMEKPTHPEGYIETLRPFLTDE